MATTSAIASANGETLTQASKTATAAAELTNATVASRRVLADRRTNEKVLKIYCSKFWMQKQN